MAVAFADAVLVRSLPFDEPDRLYRVTQTFGEGESSFQSTRVDHTVLQAWEEAFGDAARLAPVLDARRDAVFFSGGPEPERVLGGIVRPDFFEVLGISPVAGRTFAGGGAEERVVVLAHGFARRRFGDAASAVNQPLRLNGEEYRVIGVMPARLELPTPPTAMTVYERPELWTTVGSESAADVDYVLLRTIRDLDPGTVERALERGGVAAGARESARVELQPLGELLLGGSPRVLALFAGASILALLMAAVNLAGLFVVRFVARAREVAVRSALGGRPQSIVWTLFGEAALVCGLGLGLGMLLANWGIDGLRASAPPELPGVSHIALSGPVLIGMASMAVLVALLSGGIPALRTVRHSSAEHLRHGARSVARRVSRARAGMLIVQIAITAMLLYGSVLLTRTLLELGDVAAGLPADDVVVADLHRPPMVDEKRPAVDVYREIVRGVAELPGVRAVGLTSSVPLRSRDYFAPNWRWRVVDAGYFDVVSIPILAGRTFDAGDRDGAQPVAIVNHTLAQQAFGTDDVVGRMLDDRLIVGVVADVRHRRLDEPTEPELYVPVAQHGEDRLSLMVLADRAPEALHASVREAVHAVDPAQPVSNLTTFGELKARSPGVTERRFHGRVFLVVAIFSVLLAAIGLYGMAAQFVLDRRRELGIRLALGATPRSVRRMVLGRVAALGSIGLAAGGAGALLGSRLLRHVVFGVAAADAVSFVSTVAIVMAVVALAGVVPAMRAGRLDVDTLLRF